MGEGLKPFDLKKALMGDPVVTRIGEKVTEIHDFAGIAGLVAVMAIAGVCGGALFTFARTGRWNGAEDSSFDLFMAPKQRTEWVNVYKQESGSLIAAAVPYTSEQAAKDAAAKSTMRLVKILPVEYEE